MIMYVFVKEGKDMLFDFWDKTGYINIIVVIDIWLQCRMILHFRMVYTIYGDVVELLLVIIFQEKIQEILNRSPLYGRNFQMLG